LQDTITRVSGNDAAVPALMPIFPLFCPITFSVNPLWITKGKITVNNINRTLKKPIIAKIPQQSAFYA
ncbi:MAG: hypothetical protein RR387_06835, partial [Clostridiales bacterium]